MTDFAEVYANYAGLVRRVLSGLLPAADVDDGVQEVFLKIHRHLDGFRGESSLKSWVYRITFNTAQDIHRSQSWQRFLKPGATVQDRRDFRPNAEARLGDHQILQQGLQKLSFKERSAVVLFYWEEQSLEDIARHLKIPEGTVKSRLCIARRKLQSWLEKEGEVL
ncbi:RNA polymerase sigma factor [Oligoflexus tunisiensis]|uniref:RNA polymerase sigma factor n=1 Tax=Oligoflexus tunisiensis TaxID=708132 RepID=UPI00114CA620|nr:RNA polymerase sigma factor [Oligoflexus tunisiensis]